MGDKVRLKSDQTVPDGDLVVIVGASAINEELNRLGNLVQREIATLAPGRSHSAEEIEAAQSRNEGLYSRKIRSRTVYLSSVRDDPNTLNHVKWLNDRGAEVRTASRLPVRMIVIDRKLAVLPADMANGMSGIAIHRMESAVMAFQELFEMVWATAKPIGMVRNTGGSELSVEERTILEFVALGHTDKEIGASLGMCDRTVRRRIGAIQQRLNVDSRPKAIYIAAKIGLI